MTTSRSVHLNLSGDSDSPATSTNTWVGLEQEYVPEVSQVADLTDVQKMLALARSGVSASEYKRSECPVKLKEESTAEVTLNFYVWPSSLSLQYNLNADVGTVTSKKHISLPRSFDVVAEMQDTIQLPYLFEGECTWETACYDEFGVAVSPPTATIVGSEVQLSSKVFGVLRIEGVANGYEHSVIMTFDSVFVPETDVQETTQQTTASDSFFPGSRVWFPGSRVWFPGSHSWGFDSATGSNFDDWGVAGRAHSLIEQDDEIISVDAEDNEEGFNNITNLTNSITCTWVDEGEGKDLQLSLRIPKCVLDVLASCPGDNEWSSNLIAEPPNDYNIIYFDACWGSFLCRQYVKSKH